MERAKHYFSDSQNVIADTFIENMGGVFGTYKVEVGTTGYKGGDFGHGCRTYIKIAPHDGYNMNVKVIGRDVHELGFMAEIGGDAELGSIIEALRWAADTLEIESCGRSDTDISV